jgi:hypothetical protein
MPAYRSVCRTVLITVALVAAAAVPAGAGTPTEDYTAVRTDWQEDGTITACRFSEAELQNARTVAESNPDFAYTGLGDAIDAEIARWRSGGCAGLVPESTRAKSPLAGVRIVSIRPRGRAAKERVVLLNSTRKTVNLGRTRLQNRRGNRRVVLPSRLRLRAGRRLTVFSACLRGKRRPAVRGARLYACSRRELWRDRGDVARLLDRRRVVVSQRGWGTKRRVPRF